MSAIIFDTELTDRKEGEIIEAAYIRFCDCPDLAGTNHVIPPNLDVRDEWEQRYKPSLQISYGAMAIHHILPHELEDCPPSAQFNLPEGVEYMIGHSIDMDWIAAGSPAHIKRIDTHAIAQWLWPEASGYSQSALIYMLEGATPDVRGKLRSAHNALHDCWLNFSLLDAILRLKPEIQTWQQLWEYSEECRIPRTCPLKRWEGVLLENMDDGAITWCLDQHWLDPYFRKGLLRVLEKREEEWTGSRVQSLYE